MASRVIHVALILDKNGNLYLGATLLFVWENLSLHNQLSGTPLSRRDLPQPYLAGKCTTKFFLLFFPLLRFSSTLPFRGLFVLFAPSLCT